MTEQDISKSVDKEEVKKVLACPHCRRKLDPATNKRKKWWRCYVCGEKFEQPFARSEDYYTKIIGFKKLRVPIRDENNRIVPGEFVTESKPIYRKKKRSLDEQELITREELKKQIDEYRKKHIGNKYNKTLRNIAYICFLFLTGCRVEEVVGMRFIDKIENKPVPGKFVVEPIKKKQIKIIHYKKENSILWKFERLPVLKTREDMKIDQNTGELKRKIKYRDVFIIYDIEREFCRYLESYLDTLKNDDDVVFDFSRTHGWRLCCQFNGSYNHYWRHLRATDLKNTYRFDKGKITAFFDWSSDKMAERYTHETAADLVDMMFRGYRFNAEEVVEMSVKEFKDMSELKQITEESSEEDKKRNNDFYYQQNIEYLQKARDGHRVEDESPQQEEIEEEKKIEIEDEIISKETIKEKRMFDFS
jgi:integrase